MCVRRRCAPLQFPPGVQSLHCQVNRNANTLAPKHRCCARKFAGIFWHTGLVREVRAPAPDMRFSGTGSGAYALPGKFTVFPILRFRQPLISSITIRCVPGRTIVASRHALRRNLQPICAPMRVHTVSFPCCMRPLRLAHERRQSCSPILPPLACCALRSMDSCSFVSRSPSCERLKENVRFSHGLWDFVLSRRGARGHHG